VHHPLHAIAGCDHIERAARIMGERYAFSKVSWDNGVLTITVYDSEENKFFEFVYRAFDFLALTERAAIGAQPATVADGSPAAIILGTDRDVGTGLMRLK
jgi:hypothetical protein